MLNKILASIKLKIIFALVISTFIALSLSSVILTTYTFQKDKSKTIHALQEVVQIFSYNLSASLTFDDADSANLLLKSLQHDSNIEAAFILDAKKQNFASYSLENNASKMLLHTLVKKYKQKDIQQNITLLDDSCMLVSMPIYADKEYLATLFIASNTDAFYENLREQFIFHVVVFILTMLFVFLLALKIQKVFTTPIVQLKNAMETIVTTNQYDITLETNSNDEFKTLFASFNIMLDRINEANTALQNQKNFIQTLLDSQEQFIITTDGKKLITANKTFFDFFAVNDVEEFMHSYNANCVCDTFNTEAPDGYLQIRMGKGEQESWIDYIISRSFGTTHKVMISIGSEDFIFSVSAAKLPGDDGIKSAVFTNITEMEKAKLEIETQQQQFESMVSNVPGVIYRCLLDEYWTMIYINDEIESLSGYKKGDFINNAKRTFADIIHPDDLEAVSRYIASQLEKHEPYNIDYRIVRSDGKERWVKGQGQAIYSSDNSVGWLDGVIFDITEVKHAHQSLQALHKHTRESIEYASLIQGALIPEKKMFKKYFSDFFTIWNPKDTVGGDIYLFEELREKDECLLMFIDCTGHGVPGAFVTMLVKAIERQITAKINNDPTEVVSPAKILSIFNKNMKQLLKQESSDSVSNAGFDGGIFYYNKKDKIIKYAGAETALFYVEDDEQKMIKGDRYSVGYKKCSADYEYKEHILEVKEGMQFYLTTDGYLDQNGGEKGFPFGKKRFKNIIENYYKESMTDQQEVFLNQLKEYQQEEERNDDVTLVGLRI